MTTGRNQLYYGDNLKIMRQYLADESVNLIYLDPPFQSGKNYNILFREEDGRFPVAQNTAFEDTWHWGPEAEEAYRDLTTSQTVPQPVTALLTGLEGFLKKRSPMFAYLVMMAPRLIEMKRILKATGSIYLHCDPTASHYLKILMDAVFGMDNFKNEIIWQYQPGSAPRDGFGRKHDNIMRYSRSGEPYFDADPVREPYSPKTLERLKHAGAREKNVEKVLERGGRIPTDVWYIPSLQGNAREAMGYPTQKPEALLERIIKASCPKNGIVLDPFCGCGTTVAVAQSLHRRWIGIDITHIAKDTIEKRLRGRWGIEPGIDYDEIGEPADLESARALWKSDAFEFQRWVVDKIGGRPLADRLRGPDAGVDGILNFIDADEPHKIIIQVKGGINIARSDIDKVAGILPREKADIGALITLEQPKKTMVDEAVGHGFYESMVGHFPVIQILNVEAILKGERLKYPEQKKART